MVMPFGLKNAGATYQRAMNLIFHDILGKILEVYIDDVVVKSKKRGDHIVDLRKVFERMRLHKLKMNPTKCIFRVQVGDFLGFVVHQRGIEVPEDKENAVINASPPRTKKELQQLLGKIQPFSPLLKLQGQNEFVWELQHQEAFEKIKAYLASPPVLVPPRAGFPLKLYISATEASIGSLLAQDDEAGVEHAIFYLSWTLTDCETWYTPMEKLCLTLYFSACKLRHYILSFNTCIIAQTDLKAVKGQTIVDFLAHYPMLDVPAVRDLEVASETVARLDLACLPEYAMLYQATVSLQPWVLYFDGSRTEILAGARVVLENQAGDCFSYSFQLEFQCTNNQAEYEALIIGLEYIPRERNFAANELAQLATGVTLKYGVRERILKVEQRKLPSWLARPDPPDEPTVAALDPIDVDWRIPLITYLTQPDLTVDKKTRFLALNYFLRGDELRRRGEDGINFRFGIPEVLVSDRGATFMGGDVEKLVNDYGIQFLHSTPYYAHSNGQAGASNKIIITLLKKLLVENPRQWHETLYETLWAYRTSKRNPTATTP
ncbi:uncharacterized protein LOC112203390 [Rosa chinensis]|uniref:uncharacterized protein LOC112203390 n=1 Tax=Rosa chinensis TaxID=74649 RepID=UPI000D08EA66|nr:uncharacterized protein LOC112203390 [Rosa chinensis]